MKDSWNKNNINVLFPKNVIIFFERKFHSGIVNIQNMINGATIMGFMKIRIKDIIKDSFFLPWANAIPKQNSARKNIGLYEVKVLVPSINLNMNDKMNAIIRKPVDFEIYLFR